MARSFRDVPVSDPDAPLPGDARPPGFKGAGLRLGPAMAFAWWVVFLDAGGEALVGGSATVQWYGVAFDGELVMTPTLGGETQAQALETKSVSVGAGVWAWCCVLATGAPVGALSVRVYLVEAVAGAGAAIDESALAAAVAQAVGAQAACEAAIAGAELATAAAVAAVQAAVELLPDEAAITMLLTMLLNQGLGPTPSATLTGATSYVIEAAQGGRQHVLYGYHLSAGAKSAEVAWSSGGQTLTADHAVPSNGTVAVGPFSRAIITAAVGNDLTLLVSDPTAELTLTRWVKTLT